VAAHVAAARPRPGPVRTTPMARRTGRQIDRVAVGTRLPRRERAAVRHGIGSLSIIWLELPAQLCLVVGGVRHSVGVGVGRNDRGKHMDAIVVKADPAELRARRERALSSVRLTEDELRAHVETGSPTPEERDAWQEVDTVAFLLGAGA
jgi:hypothetical protein